MTLEEVLRYTKSALQDACYDQYWIKEIPKFIQSQEHIIALYEHNIEYKERCIFNLQDENRRLRYERLMNKAENLHTYGLLLTEQAEASNVSMTTRAKNFKAMRCHRIAEAYEARARKIKEEM